jgi:hypothetical protein
MLLTEPEIGQAMDEFVFVLDVIGTLHLGRLAASTALPVDVAKRGGEGATLLACNIQGAQGKPFLGVYGDFESLYIRDGYDDLYNAILSQWRIPREKSVLLLGNSGTGKSWYQIYVLRRLLRRTSEYQQDPDEYDFVFREVDSEMLLIDIKQRQVYKVTAYNPQVMAYLSRCLFFFEPGENKEKPPSGIYLPSLATLSPYKKRITEWQKHDVVRLHFWPWYITELMALCAHARVFEKLKAQEEGLIVAAAAQPKQEDAVMKDVRDEDNDAAKVHQEMADAAKASLSQQVENDGEAGGEGNDFFEELFERYQKFGGILRYIVAGKLKFSTYVEELEDRVMGLNLTILRSKALNIDREATGNNVSGFILCYDGKQDAIFARSQGQGSVGFDKKVLKFTSAYVESKADEVLVREPLKEKMEIVLQRLNDDITMDLSGKNLEAAATEFLRDTVVKWEVKKAGRHVGWATYNPNNTKRTVMRQYDISEHLTHPVLILVSTNTSFPVGDMVISKGVSPPLSTQALVKSAPLPHGTPQPIAPGATVAPIILPPPVLVFQCTWQTTHPFSVRALYQLRRKKLHLADSQKVFLFFIVPGKEESYAKRARGDYLKGSVDVRLEYSTHEIVEAPALQEMWSNTEVYILRPVNAWSTIIGNWLLGQKSKQ